MWNLQVLLQYLIQHSVETNYYMVRGGCNCHTTNTRFTQDLGLSQRCLCRFQSSGIWLRVDRLERTTLWEKLNAFLCFTLNASVQPTYLYWLAEWPLLIENTYSSAKQVVSTEHWTEYRQVVTNIQNAFAWGNLWWITYAQYTTSKCNESKIEVRSHLTKWGCSMGKVMLD
jgi:hypothetical protein